MKGFRSQGNLGITTRFSPASRIILIESTYRLFDDSLTVTGCFSPASRIILIERPVRRPCGARAERCFSPASRIILIERAVASNKKSINLAILSFSPASRIILIESL